MWHSYSFNSTSGSCGSPPWVCQILWRLLSLGLQQLEQSSLSPQSRDELFDRRHRPVCPSPLKRQVKTSRSRLLRKSDRRQNGTECRINSNTFQVLHGRFPETILFQDRGCLLTLPASCRVLAASKRVFHIGVGDENDHAWICKRDRGGLQRPESNQKQVQDG